jgi:hypothetical protein
MDKFKNKDFSLENLDYNTYDQMFEELSAEYDQEILSDKEVHLLKKHVNHLME